VLYILHEQFPEAVRYNTVTFHKYEIHTRKQSFEDCEAYLLGAGAGERILTKEEESILDFIVEDT
jgi:hypothetical protein